MKASFPNYPVDIIACMLLSLFLVPLVLFDMNGTLRIALGLPFILFFPGYVLVFALFPARKFQQGIDVFERLALSFGLSLALVPLVGLLLNYTPWGIRLEPILFSLFFFIVGVGCLGAYRWFNLPLKQRFIITVNLSFPQSENKVDKTLFAVLMVCVVVVVGTLVYMVLTPRQGEQFTEFYLLGPGGIADEYPSTLVFGENATGFVGIVNHEHRSINYTIEVWLLRQSIFFNESSLENETVFSHLWFIDKIQVSLDHSPVDIETVWTPQWQQYFSYTVPQPGLGKLLFLLFTTDTDEYMPGEDYVFLAQEKIASAYQDLHLWLRITHTGFYLLGPDGGPETYIRDLSAGENLSGVVGIINNELRMVNYTVDIWLVNESISFDSELQQNVSFIENMWYLDSIKVRLNHSEEAVAWEQNYSVMINKTGRYKVMFFLFTTPTEGYFVGQDYKQRASLIFASARMQQSILVNVT